jgi:hypothetical protein
VSLAGRTLPRTLTQDHNATGKIRSIEKSTDIIGNRTLDLTAPNIAPQPTKLPRAPIVSAVELS